jgi:hypothetical protein
MFPFTHNGINPYGFPVAVATAAVVAAVSIDFPLLHHPRPANPADQLLFQTK